MITDVAYRAGCDAAFDCFVKVADVGIMSFARGKKGVPLQTPRGQAPQAPQATMKDPIVGGAANPAVTAANTIPAQNPAVKKKEPNPASSGWRGFGKDLAIQAAIPLAMTAAQHVLPPTEPQPANQGLSY